MNFKIEKGFVLPEYETRFKKTRKNIQHIYNALGRVKNFDIAVDVGANVGLITSIMATKFKKVYAFECVPETFECLKENVTKYDNVEINFYAVSDSTGSVKLAIPKENGKIISSGWATINKQRMESFPEKDFITVNTRTLDSLDLPGLDLLKIDVEQAEMMVIRGAYETIKKYRPVIDFENKRNENRHVIDFLQKEFNYTLTPESINAVDSIMIP